MNDLPKDIIRLLVFDYVDGEYAINFLKICRKVYNSFSSNERNLIRMKSLYFMERCKQLKYIRKVIDEMTIKGIEENERRAIRGVKQKKYNYFFCEGCASVIRPATIRCVRHLDSCKRTFHNCKWCGIPYSCNKFSNSGISKHGHYLLHREKDCPRIKFI